MLLPLAAEDFSPAPGGAGMITGRVSYSRGHSSGKQQKTLFAIFFFSQGFKISQSLYYSRTQALNGWCVGLQLIATCVQQRGLVVYS